MDNFSIMYYNYIKQIIIIIKGGQQYGKMGLYSMWLCL